MRDLQLFDASFTARDATVIFVLSRMRVIDEEGGNASMLRLENLSKEDWYEAICRVAVAKALPSDDDIAASGAEDAGDFVLQLRKSPSDYEAWLEHWYQAHDAALVKATQPPHRCISHLVMLMVRTVEECGARGENDLHVTKEEMDSFMVAAA